MRALAQERSLRGSLLGVSLCFSAFWRAIGVLGCGMRWWTRTARVRLNAANTTPSACLQFVSTKLARRWSLSFYLFCVLVNRRNKTTRRSLTGVCAQSLTAHDGRKNWDCVGAVMSDSNACNHLSAGMDAVKDHKANTSLTELYLYRNNVGDAGAGALADALQATVLACRSKSFKACASCFRRCRFVKWFQQLTSPSY